MSEVWVRLRDAQSMVKTRERDNEELLISSLNQLNWKARAVPSLKEQDGPRVGSYSLTWRAWALESREVAGSCIRTGNGRWGGKIRQRTYCFPFAFAFPSPCSSQLYFLEGKSKIKSDQSSVSFHEPILSVCHL
jgi:hypothetical protein